MSFHNRLIELIVKNKEKLEWIVGMYNTKIQKEVSLSNFGDIDIYITGIDTNTQKERVAIIEVKSHKGLVNHYLREQLPKYLLKFPGAKQFVAYSKNDSLNFEDIEFEMLKG